MVRNSYDGFGRLVFVSGRGTGLSFDGFNFTASESTQKYDLDFLRDYGLSKVLTTRTRSFTSDEDRGGRFARPLTNADGSWSRQDILVQNIYDRDDSDGRAAYLINVTGTGTLASDDGFGNSTTGTIDQTNDQAIIALTGQTKLKTSTSITDTLNRDGSTVHSEITTTNMYENTRLVEWSDTNGNGIRERDELTRGDGFSLSFDGFGSYTRSNIQQDFEVIRGAARLVEARTESFTSDAAGNGSFDEVFDLINNLPSQTNLDDSFAFQRSVVNYQNNHRGQLARAEGRTASLSSDGRGNYTASGDLDWFRDPATASMDPNQGYEIIRGQARLVRNVNKTFTSNAGLGGSFDSPAQNADRSWTRQTITTFNEYNLDTGILTKTHGEGIGLSNDGTRDDGSGNYQATRIIQNFEIINGQARVAESITESWTSDAQGRGSLASPIPGSDDAWSANTSSTNFYYDADGKLIHAEGTSTGRSNDGFDRYTASNGRLDYVIILGQARVDKAVTDSFTSNYFGEGSFDDPLRNPDGSFNRQTITVTNFYDGSTGEQMDVTGRGTTYSEDAFGNVSFGTIDQHYKNQSFACPQPNQN